MKQYPKLSFLLLACIAIGYSACIKSANNNNNKSNSSTVSTKVVSSTVAMNLKQILYGEYGSFNIADGANMPDDMNQSHKGHLKVQSTHAPDCGFKIDTAFQFALDLSDTAKFSIWNKIKYNVQCTGSSFGPRMEPLKLRIKAPNLSIMCWICSLTHRARDYMWAIRWGILPLIFLHATNV